jgi:hypothetical protein
MPADASTRAADSAFFKNLESSIHFVFSWVVLLPVAVILTGKLLGRLVALGFSGDDKISINIYFSRFGRREMKFHLD